MLRRDSGVSVGGVGGGNGGGNGGGGSSLNNNNDGGMRRGGRGGGGGAGGNNGGGNNQRSLNLPSIQPPMPPPMRRFDMSPAGLPRLGGGSGDALNLYNLLPRNVPDVGPIGKTVFVANVCSLLKFKLELYTLLKLNMYTALL